MRLSAGGRDGIKKYKRRCLYETRISFNFMHYISCKINEKNVKLAIRGNEQSEFLLILILLEIY